MTSKFIGNRELFDYIKEKGQVKKKELLDLFGSNTNAKISSLRRFNMIELDNDGYVRAI